MPDETPEDYEIGYGRPPKHTRFRPGQSGNPNGRPKRTKDLEKLFERELERKIQITENGQKKTVSLREAFVKSVVSDAVKGKREAQKIVLAHMGKAVDVEGFEIDAAAEAMLQAFIDEQAKEGRADVSES